MWKTVSARLRGAKTELEDMGEDTTDMVTSTSKLRDLVMGITGFDIMKSDTEFKDIYDIIMGIGAEWDNINDIDKAALLEALAGKRQANALAATLQNTEMLADAYATAEDSAGSAMREQENFEKGIQYSLNRFKATGQSALMDIVGSGPIKGAIDAGNALIKLLDTILSKTGMLGPALAAAVAVMSKRSGNGLFAFDKVNNQFSGAIPNTIRAGRNQVSEFVKDNPNATLKQRRVEFFGGVSKYINGNRLQKADNDYMRGFAEYINHREIDKTTWAKRIQVAGSADAYYDELLDTYEKEKGLNKEQVEKSRKRVKNMLKEDEDIVSSTSATTKMQQKLYENRSAGEKIKGAVGGFVSQALQAGVMMAVSAAAQFVMDKISEKTITFDEAREGVNSMISSYHNLRDTANDNIKSIKEIEDEYARLRKGVNAVNNQNISLSDAGYERFLELNNQIAQSFPDLVSGYDAEGNAILRLTDTVNGLADAYVKAKQAAAESLIIGDKEAGTDFQTFLQAYQNATSSIQATNTEANWLSRIQGKFATAGNTILGEYEIGVDTSYENAKTSLEQLKEQRGDIAKLYKSEMPKLANENVKGFGLGVASPIATFLAPVEEYRQGGLDAVQTIKDIAGFTDKTQKEVYKILKSGNQDDINELIKTYEDKFKQESANHDELINASRDYLVAFAQSGEALYKMSEEQQATVNTLLSNLSDTAIDKVYQSNPDDRYGAFESFAKNVTSDIGKYYTEISQLQNILSNVDNLNTTNVAMLVNGFNDLDGKVAGLSALDLSDAFGATDAINTTIDFQNAIKKLDGNTSDLQKTFNSMNLSEMETFLDVFNELSADGITDATQMLEAYKNKLVEVRHAQGEIGDHSFQDAFGAGSQFEAATNATAEGAQDFGTTWTSMKSMLATAKEAEKVGNTGTEAFKSISGMFDAYGSTSVESFSDNLSTLNRYFGESVDAGEAVNNFLDDLMGKTNDAGEQMVTLDDATGDYILNLGDLKYAAEQAGLGYESFLAMLDLTQAQGGIIEHFDNLEDGYQRVGELQGELATEEAKLAAMQVENSGYTQDAIDAQTQKVAELRAKYETAQEAVANFRDTLKESLEFDTAYTTGLASNIKSDAITAKGQTGETRTESEYAVLQQRDALQEKVNNLALEWGADFDISKFGDLKTEIDDANEAMRDLFNNDDHEIKYSFTGEELDELSGETAASMDISTDVANVFANALNADDVLNHETNPDTTAYREKQKEKFNELSPESKQEIINAGKNSLADAQERARQSREESGQNTIYDPATGRALPQRDLGNTPFRDWLQNGQQSTANQQTLEPGRFASWLMQQRSSYQERQQSGDTYQPSWLMNQRSKWQERQESGNTYTPMSYQLQDRFDTWRQNLKQQQTSTQQSVVDSPTTKETKEVETKFTADTTESDQAFEETENKGKLFENNPFKGLLQADNTEANASIDSTMTQANVLNGFTAMIHTLAQDNANPVLQKLDAFLQGLDGDNATVETDAEDNATPILDFVRSVVDGLSGDSATVDLNATDGVTPVAQEAESAVDNIGGTDISLTADSSAGVVAANELSGAINGVQGKSVTISAITSGLEAVQSLRSAIAGVVGKSVRVVTNFVTKRTTEATGTLNGFSRGTIGAFASGSKVSIDRDQDAIVNELGEEGLIRDGVMHRIVGGMQQIHLKKGDIVVNHKQMEELEKGEVKSNGGRGRLIGSFANGTLDGMNAFSGNSGRIKRDRNYDSSSTKSNTKATNDNTKATESNTDAKDEEKSAAEKLKEEFDKLYDWVEVFIDRTDQMLSRLETQAEDTTKHWYTQNAYLQKAMDLANSEQKKLNDSYNKYIAQANASGLSEAYKIKVQQGRKNEIESIDTDSELRARVDEYEKWYEKAQDVLDKQIEWQQKVWQLENERLQNIQDFYDAAVSYHSSTQEWYEAQQGTHEARGDSLSASNSLIQKQIVEQQKQSALLAVEVYKYRDEMNRSAKIFGTTSQEYYKAYSNYMQIQKAFEESATAAYELRDALFENARTLKEQVTDKWERVLNRIDAARTYYSARPDDIKTQDANVIQTYIDENKNTQNKIAALNSSIGTYRNQMQYYDKTSKQYQDLADKVNSAEVEIMNLSADMYNNLGEIFDTYTKRFDTSVDKLTHTIDEASGLISLMGEESFVDKAGNITDNGQAGIALYGTMIAQNTQAMEDWRKAIDDVNAARKNGLISEEKANELISEYTDNIQDAVAKNKDFSQSLVEIYKKQLENENSALQKNIDARKQALQSKEAYYDYDKQLKASNKDIQSLEAQIAALEGTFKDVPIYLIAGTPLEFHTLQRNWKRSA